MNIHISECGKEVQYTVYKKSERKEKKKHKKSMLVIHLPKAPSQLNKSAEWIALDIKLEPSIISVFLGNYISWFAVL